MAYKSYGAFRFAYLVAQPNAAVDDKSPNSLKTRGAAITWGIMTMAISLVSLGLLLKG
jgi:hypothetical protein